MERNRRRRARAEKYQLWHRHSPELDPHAEQGGRGAHDGDDGQALHGRRDRGQREASMGLLYRGAAPAMPKVDLRLVMSSSGSP